MPEARTKPDLTLTLSAELYAPRMARLAVGQLDNPSPDLRDATMLLTSNLVTRAVRAAREDSDSIQVRAWMPRRVVRVEVRAPERLLAEFEPASPGLERDLLQGLSDRWGVEREPDAAVAWFEIDRVPADRL